MKMKFIRKIFSKKTSEAENNLAILCLKQQEELLKIREEMEALQEKYNQVNHQIYKTSAPQRRMTFTVERNDFQNGLKSKLFQSI